MAEQNSKNYAILRVKKLKTVGSLSHSLKHAFRERETPNAAEGLKGENRHFGAESTEEALAKFRKLMPEKVRKNAVLTLEYLVTASPEVMASKTKADQDEYFRDSIKWLQKRHGKENVFYAGVHRDESNPHMYAYVVPLVDRPKGKSLCARDFVGGKQKLSAMQTDFAEKVGTGHGLKRGKLWSQVRHVTMQEIYYQRSLNREKTPDVTMQQIAPTKKMGKKPEEYAAETLRNFGKYYKPYLDDLKQKSDSYFLLDQQISTLNNRDKKREEYVDRLEAEIKRVNSLSPTELRSIAKSKEQKTKKIDQSRDTGYGFDF